MATNHRTCPGTSFSISLNVKLGGGGEIRTLHVQYPLRLHFFTSFVMVARNSFESHETVSQTVSPRLLVHFVHCGGGEIRTPDTLRYAAFPRRWNKPLSDTSERGV